MRIPGTDQESISVYILFNTAKCPELSIIVHLTTMGNSAIYGAPVTVRKNHYENPNVGWPHRRSASAEVYTVGPMGIF